MHTTSTQAMTMQATTMQATTRQPMSRQEMTVRALRERYEAGDASPEEVIEEVFRRIGARGDDAVWIHRVPREVALRRARELQARRERGESLPLFGIPFAVKDNIDVAEAPTTAACPAFAYVPEEDAPAVRRLLDAGAILIGKTNLDQFATGLVGTRSPYGEPRCVHNPEFVSGGSSSGSAVAVAAGLVAFALGTDTAGSGRVPAAFNGIVGLKPTRGRVSTRGVVPACRSLDCVTVFAASSDDAAAVLEVMEGYDPGDPYSRVVPASPGTEAPATFRFGVPRPDQLRFFGDAESAALYHEARAALRAIGGREVEIDLAPFLEAAEMLYGGPWVAERDAAVGDFLRANPSASHPVVRTLILGAARFSATDAFRALHQLEALRRRTAPAWEEIDVLALPTTGTIYRVDEVLAEPYALNANLGYYTNFMNLLDLCGLALPAGFRANRTPFGITLAAPAFRDGYLAEIGASYEAQHAERVRAPLPAHDDVPSRGIRLAVVGAHLAGQPLNHQLTSRGARLVWSGRTAPAYRLFALSGSAPAKPGLVHAGEGAAIEVEVWELDEAGFGSFVAEVPPPLAIGTVELEDGTSTKGFVCEPRATAGAEDITHHGGWRAYRVTVT